jgi:hypothetical protein
MKPGRERVKSWIYSVINPVLNGLRTEEFFLSKGNWTFRQYSRDLEFIRPVESYVDFQSRPIWEDFSSSDHIVGEQVSHRDNCREELHRACQAAFLYLLESPGFKDQVSRCLANYQRAEGGGLGQEPEKLVAERVTNNIDEVPGHYTDHRFWTAYGAQFRRFRVGEPFDRADQAGRVLKDNNDEVSAKLTKLRAELAEQYDIPWAPYYDESVSVAGR